MSSGEDDESTFLYLRLASFVGVILVLVLLRYLLQRWYRKKLAAALEAQQQTLAQQQRELEELTEIEARIMENYHARTGIPPSNSAFLSSPINAVFPEEPPPVDYETAMKCQVLEIEDYLEIDMDEPPPSYSDYLETLGSNPEPEVEMTSVHAQMPNAAGGRADVTKESTTDGSHQA